MSWHIDEIDHYIYACKAVPFASDGRVTGRENTNI